MGRLYGQPSRLLLNYDAVFLGELLTALKPTPFATAYTSRNCFHLPATTEQMPLALQYAATANVMLAEFKLRDHVTDSHSVKAKLALRTFSGAFGKAQKQLQTWRFPLEKVRALLHSQAVRERDPLVTLPHVIEPTATATRLVFAHGADLMGTGDTVRENMARLGESFGRIAYLADAMQDQIEDAKTGDFNALTATNTPITLAREHLKTWQSEMLVSLNTLPISQEQKTLFGSRLQANLNPYLSGTPLAMAGAKSQDEEEKRRRGDGCNTGSGYCDTNPCHCCSDCMWCGDKYNGCDGCDCGGCHCHC
jgi:Family of unknown function (DUF5685)